jgi:hypothetical protein
MHFHPAAGAGRRIRLAIVFFASLPGLGIPLGFPAAPAAEDGDRAAGLRINVRSHEEPSIDGSFTVDFAVTVHGGGPFGLVPGVKFERGEECLLAARQVSGGDPPDELGPGERYTGRFEVTYAAERRPFSYRRLWLGLRAPGIPRPVVFEPVYVYFTPFDTVEVWSVEDFERLKRVWNSPGDRTGRRRALRKEQIPASDVTEVELARRGARVRLVSLPGLGYSVPRRIPSGFAAGGPGFVRAGRTYQAFQAGGDPGAGAKFQAGAAAQLDARAGAGGGGGGGNSNQFEGTVSGRIFATVDDDFGNSNSISLDIVGIKVELMRKRSLGDEVIGTDFTEEGGEFDIAFDVTLNDPDIDVYLQVTAENEAGTIRVRKRLGGARSETHFKDSPNRFQPGTGLSFDFGAVEVDEDDVKPQLFHWANRARSFVEDELGDSILPSSSSDPLDIMRSFSGTGQAYFIPGGYATDAALIAPLVFGPLGIPLGLVLATVVSNNDSIYVGSDRQLDEDVVYHEFGHYLMWHLQAESWLDPLKAGFATHYQDANDEHAELAWTEGFASGFGAIVDSVCQADDGEFGIDNPGVFEDRDTFQSGCQVREAVTWPGTICGAGSTPNCPSGQVLTHGFHSEWNVASMIWDLWDGSSQPGAGVLQNICDPADLDGDGTVIDPGASFDDGGQDTLELSFQEIVQPILDNPGTGGFLFQGGNLVSDVLEYFTELRDNLPGSLGGLPPAAGRRAIKDVLVLNGIRNLARDVAGSGIVRRSVEADLPNTDELSFVRDVTVDFYTQKANGTWKSKGSKTNPFTVDITALLDGNDSYNLGNTGVATKELTDDLLVTGEGGPGSATLFVNAPGIAGWRSNLNSYGLPAGLAVVVGPSLDVALAGGMTLEVRDGARLVLGNSLGTLTGVVRVKSGGRLILRDGTLTVNQASRVVIERGATLEIDVGAVIELNGPPTALEIHGDLLIRAGAEFTYGGGGYVLFDLPDAGGLANVTMEPGSIINIEESRFVIQSDTYVKPTEDPSTQVIMWYANGEFGSKSYFDVSYSTLRIEGSRITGGAGVVVNGYPNTIFDSRFAGGDPCIHALRKGSSPLSVRTSEFVGGSYGILSEGITVGVSDSTFNGFGTAAVQVSDATAGLSRVQIVGSGIGLSTIRGGGGLVDSEISGCLVGWYAEDLQVDSGVEGGVVRNNILYGIHDNGQYGVQIASVLATSQPEFSLEETSVDNNRIGVWASGPVRVTASCSEVVNHITTGFHIAAGAILDLAGSAGVQVTGNLLSVQFDLAAMPLLNLGDSNFMPAAGGMTLAGTIDAPCSFGSMIPAERNTGGVGVALGAAVTNVTDPTGTCSFNVTGVLPAQAVMCP